MKRLELGGDTCDTRGLRTGGGSPRLAALPGFVRRRTEAVGALNRAKCCAKGLKHQTHRLMSTVGPLHANDLRSRGHSVVIDRSVLPC